MERERFQVRSVTGYAAGNYGRTSRPTTDYMILDSACAWRVVAYLGQHERPAGDGRGRITDTERAQRAYAIAGEFNAANA